MPVPSMSRGPDAGQMAIIDHGPIIQPAHHEGEDDSTVDFEHMLMHTSAEEPSSSSLS